MENSTSPTRMTATRLLVPATLVTGVVAGSFFAMSSVGSTQAAGGVASVQLDGIPASIEPDGVSTTAVPTTVAAESDVIAQPDERGVGDGMIGEYTLADAAVEGDPRVAGIECEYLFEDEDDPRVRVMNFRADRDRFFDIDSAVVQESRLDGLSFTEIAAEHGFDEVEVEQAAAAMHGYCYQQLIGERLTAVQAEARFQRTIVRFSTLVDAEPTTDGRGAAGAGTAPGGCAAAGGGGGAGGGGDRDGQPDGEGCELDPKRPPVGSRQSAAVDVTVSR